MECIQAKKFLISYLKEANVIFYFFNFFLDIKYIDYRGPGRFDGIKPSNFGHWQYIFDKCMGDLTEGKD